MVSHGFCINIHVISIKTTGITLCDHCFRLNFGSSQFLYYYPSRCNYQQLSNAVLPYHMFSCAFHFRSNVINSLLSIMFGSSYCFYCCAIGFQRVSHPLLPHCSNVHTQKVDRLLYHDILRDCLGVQIFIWF